MDSIGSGTVIALVSAALSVTVTTVTATAWLRGQFAALGERLAKAEAMHKSLHDRVEKLESAREEDVRRALARHAT